MTTQDSKPPAQKGPTNEQAQEVDIALIKQTVTDLEKSQSQRRADDFVRLFTPNAVWNHRFR